MVQHVHVTPAYGTDQDPEGGSQRSKTNGTEIQFCLFEQWHPEQKRKCYRDELLFQEKMSDHTALYFDISIILWSRSIKYH